MAERPIIFSGPMVRAIIEGRKTQTRRVYKPKEGFPRLDGEVTPASSDQWTEWGPCPYGIPGDTLWVRESWCGYGGPPIVGGRKVVGAAVKQSNGGVWLTTDQEPVWVHYRADHGGDPPLQHLHWRPSIHMPRWACRLTLAVKAVRVERLQGISEADAVAEGVVNHYDGRHGQHWDPSRNMEIGPHQHEFMRLWDSINGKRHPWAGNPWVWVVEFEKEADRG